MNIKKLFQETFPVVMLFTALFSVTACSDDDDDNEGSGNNETEIRDLTEDMVLQRYAVESIMANLANAQTTDTMGFDLTGKSYEPTIGQVRDEARPLERSVLVEDEVDASLKFRNLVANDDLVQETSDGYIIDLSNLDYRLDGKKQNVGKLTYHRMTDGSCEAYADVEMPSIPKLQRITYVTKAQWGSNGWEEDGSWTSPCLFGQVWYNISQNLYYVCVVQSKSDTDGWLINVQTGRSNMYYKVAGNEGDKGAWKPQHPVSKAAVEGFVNLCINSTYYDMKHAIRKKYPNKIFPPVPVRHGKGESCNWSNYGYLHTTDGDDGFGTTQKGYGHYVGDLGNDNPKDYDTPGSGPEVQIIRDGWEGCYHFWKARHCRNQEYYCMAPRAHYKSSRYWHTTNYVYTRFEDSDFCDGKAWKYCYTANGYSFRANPPSGFRLVFDPDTDM